MNTFYIKTLGCKLNQYDSQVLEEQLCKQHFTRVEDYLSAQYAIINTCTVTSRSDYEARRLIRKIKRENPNCFIVVTGCYVQRNPEEIARIDGVNVIVGNEDRKFIPKIIKEHSIDKMPQILHKAYTNTEQAYFYPIRRFTGHTRAFLKIQEGCNYNCSYCIVPHVRGRSRSVPSDEILSAIQGLLEKGLKEIVLTGIDIGDWKEPGLKEKKLLYMLEQIEKIKYPFRIRLSSIEPKEIHKGLIGFIASSAKVVPHLHIPLQSGSDTILKAMKRPYSRNFYYQMINTLKEKIPDLCLGSDVVVGFPGEGEQEFKETYDLIDTLSFSYLHVFPFSPRPGTAAASLKQTETNKVITDRAKVLRQLAAKKNVQFRSSFMGKELSCLVLTKAKSEGSLIALSNNYIKINFKGKEELKNKLITIKITEVTQKETFGEQISKKKIASELKSSMIN
jgi:threonylcarbamoyladenosine tRNA methylthiotransferase MtaB